jgi:hypothetical protein
MTTILYFEPRRLTHAIAASPLLAALLTLGAVLAQPRDFRPSR